MQGGVFRTGDSGVQAAGPCILALLGENFIDRRLVWQAELCPDSDRPDHILRNLVVPVCVFRLTETV